jgi:hypothetical protein
MGEGSEEGLVNGVELAVRKMKKGEKCEVIIKPEYAFGPNGKLEFSIPKDYSEVVYEIKLNNFEKVKESYQMDNSERIEQSILVKTKGTKYFKVLFGLHMICKFINCFLVKFLSLFYRLI